MKKSLLATLFVVILTQSAGAMQQQPQGPSFNGAIQNANVYLLSTYLKVLKNEKVNRPEKFADHFRNFMNTYNENGYHPLYALIMQPCIKAKKRLKIIELLMKLGVNTKAPYKQRSESIYTKVEQLTKEKNYYKKVFAILSTTGEIL